MSKAWRDEPPRAACGRKFSNHENPKGVERRLSVGVLNSHLLCVLCSGYLVDATAIVECLHRFCRSCIVTYLKDNRFCPICDVQIQEGKQWDSLRPDDIIQNLVYKMVPGLYKREMYARSKFYEEKGVDPPDGEAGGKLPPGDRFYSQEDGISMSLEYYNEEENYLENNNNNVENNSSPTTCKLYLKCPAAVSVRHLKKFLRIKFELGTDKNIDIIYDEECLQDSFSLMDVAYTFKWDRSSPLRLAFRIYNKPVVKITTQIKGETTQLPIKPAETSPNVDPRHQQRQSEYLGHLNLNPRGQPKANGPVDDFENSRNKAEESDSATSELRIVSEKETADPSSDEEYHPKTIKRLGKRKKHEGSKKCHPQKRRKSDSFAESMKKKSFLDKKGRRKSMFDGAQQSTDDGEGETLKNEALKKVFIYKEKPEIVVFKKKDESLKRKKRKKSKHHEGETKKRKGEVVSAPSILSVAKDALKLKVKLAPLKVPKETNGSKDEEHKIDKERLLHLRSVRHKNIVNKKDYISTPPSLTISKVGLNENGPGKTSLVESKPSLEIMLVNKKDDGGSKAKTPADSGVLDLSEKAKVLDLSDKSTRVKEVSPVGKSPNKTTQQSILQIAETLVNRKLSPSPDVKLAEESVAVVAMRDLKTLSDAAVNILMAAQSQAQAPKREENGTALKIPVFPRERLNPVPPVPNLHEIYPRGRGRPLGGSPRVAPVIKPGQNQTVRQIPDPSVILNRQNNIFHQQMSRPDSSTSPGKSKLDSIPPLQSIKAKLPPIIEKKEPPKPMNSLKLPMIPIKPPNPVSSSSPIKMSPSMVSVRRMDMAKNIESVAAGLTARATALIDAK